MAKIIQTTCLYFLFVQNKEMANQKKVHPQVGIIMGSDSDLEIMSQAAKILEDLNIPYEMSVISAHRTPSETAAYSKSAQSRGLKVIIAGAGGAAALPGVVASQTLLPVIGVPIKSKAVEGLDALLSISQMPPGIPVATVGIDGAKNAGLLAAQIIGLSNNQTERRLKDYKNKLKKQVLAKNSDLQKLGWNKYLKEIKK